MSDFPTRHPYSLGIWQNRIEQLMAAWIAELEVSVDRNREVTDVAQGDSEVEVRLADGGSLRAEYLVGCDGGRSVIRKADIAFPGWDPTRSNLIAEVELTEEPPRGVRHDATGVHGLHRMEDGRTFRVIVTERQLHAGGDEPSLSELRDALIAVFGTDFGVTTRVRSPGSPT
jgi:3-(3-hydroxy-phenyl)propionate hydroxylase